MSMNFAAYRILVFSIVFAGIVASASAATVNATLDTSRVYTAPYSTGNRNIQLYDEMGFSLGDIYANVEGIDDGSGVSYKRIIKSIFLLICGRSKS